MKKEKLNECQLFAQSYDITRVATLSNKHARVAFIMRLKGATFKEVSVACKVSQPRVRHVLLDGIERMKCLEKKDEVRSSLLHARTFESGIFISGLHDSNIDCMIYSLRLFKTIQLLKAAN